MNCVCQSCLVAVSTPPTTVWSATFVKELLSGQVIHIGDTPDGRPIYRQN